MEVTKINTTYLFVEIYLSLYEVLANKLFKVSALMFQTSQKLYADYYLQLSDFIKTIWSKLPPSILITRLLTVFM